MADSVLDRPEKDLEEQTRYYVLNADGKPVPAKDRDECVAWVAKHAQETIVGEAEVEDVRVETMFLWMDHHPMTAIERRQRFETKIIGGRHDFERWRYVTLAQAQRGHREIVAAVKRGEGVPGWNGHW